MAIPSDPTKNLNRLDLRNNGLSSNYVYKSIPLAFDNSMSYYQFLSGLLAYLEQTVIPAINDNEEAVTELQGLYVDLKQYIINAQEEYEETITNRVNNFEDTVNNEIDEFEDTVNTQVQSLEDFMTEYFDNLDVQDEINNKLDAMAESGELEEYLDEWLKKLDSFSNSNAVSLGSNLLTDSSLWQTNDGWTGDSTNGFAHIVGQSGDLVYNYSFTANKDYVVDFDVETTMPSGSDNAGNDFSVVIGDTTPIATYRGGGSMHYTIGLSPKTAGTLKFVCVHHGTLAPATTFVGTIKNITLKEATGSITPLVITDANEDPSLPFTIMRNDNDTIAIGDNAGVKNYNQLENVYIGPNSGSRDLTGYRNVAIGGESLMNTINGSRNVAVGYRAMWKNESGDRNIAIGPFAMSANVTGRQNIVFGFDTFMSSTSGSNNIILGHQALGGATYSQENIAIGWGCMANAHPTNTGIQNIAIGDHVGNYLTDGYRNVYIGWHAGYKTTTGNRNIAIGNTSLNDAETVDRIIAIGENAGSKITTGQFSVIIGENMSTNNLTTATSSVLIGTTNGTNMTSLTNSTIIGDRVTANTDKTAFSGVLVLNAGTSQAYISKDNYMNLANLIFGNIDSQLPQVGIKQDTPTAILHIGAGRALQGGAPIKLTAGTNLTTPEDGALEYDGTHLYFTIGSTRNTII